MRVSRAAALLLVSRLIGGQDFEEVIQKCYEGGKDYGVGTDISEVYVETQENCYQKCKELRGSGCVAFVFMSIAKMCWLKDSVAPFNDGVDNIVGGSLDCFDEVVSSLPAVDVPNEPPFTESDCFEEDVVYEGEEVLKVFFNVLGSGYTDPRWCQLLCQATPDCNYYNWFFYPGSYVNEGAQDVNKGSCNLLKSRQPARGKGIDETAEVTGGPKYCPGSGELGKPPFPPVTFEEILRINCGGPELKDPDQQIWITDKFFTQGWNEAYTEEIYWSWSIMDPIAHTGRANFKYEIPVSSSKATNTLIKLFFAEYAILDRWNRVFDVLVEGKPYLVDLDIVDIVTRIMEGEVIEGWSVFKQSDTIKGTLIQFELPLVVIEDGEINIDCVAKIGNCWVSAIEIKASQSLENKEMDMSSPGILLSSNKLSHTLTITHSGGGPSFTKQIELTGDVAEIVSADKNEIVVPKGGTIDVTVSLNTNFEEAFAGGVSTLTGKLTVDNIHWVPVVVNDMKDATTILDINPIFLDLGVISPKSLGGSGKRAIAFMSAKETCTITRVLAFTDDNEAKQNAFQLSIANSVTVRGVTDKKLPSPVTVMPDKQELIRVNFEPPVAGLYTLVLGVEIDDDTLIFMQLQGNALNTQEPHYLHPILMLPPYIVDMKGDGQLSVFCDGSFSHTHEPDMTVTKFIFSINGVILDQDEKLDTTVVHLPVGFHSVSLTIGDRNGRTLTTMDTIYVAPVTAVGGTLVLIYAVPSEDLDDLFQSDYERHSYMLGGVEPAFANRQPNFGAALDTTSLTLAGSPRHKKNIILRICGDIEFPDDSEGIELNIISHHETIIFLDGERKEKDSRMVVDPGTHHIEVRFKVIAEDSVPPELLLNGEGLSTTTVFHNEEGYPPFIRRISPLFTDMKGGGEIRIDGLFFMLPEFAKNNSKIEVIIGDSAIVDSSSNGFDVGSDYVKFILPKLDKEQVQKVSVRTPLGQSNSVDLDVMDGAPPLIKWHPVIELQNGGWLHNPTVVEWGPDGRLYVATFQGLVHSIKFLTSTTIDYDDIRTYDIVAQEYPNHHLTGAHAGPNGILGLAFDPWSDPEHPHLYVAHAPMFAQGGACFDFATVHAPFAGKIDRLTGPNYDEAVTTLANLPISNHDHGINAISFDNDGDLYVIIGVQTNYGWPTCILGGMPESHYTGAINKITLRKGWSRTIDYINHKTGEYDAIPNQVIGDTYAPAPWIEGVAPWSTGYRNAYDHIFTTRGEFWVTQNGFNEGYGEIVFGPPEPEGCIFESWDKFLGGWVNPFYPDPKCKPPLRDEFSEPDRLFQANANSYHGCPNPSRARNTGDMRQWYGRDAFAANSPPTFTQGFALTPSLVGITEFRGGCFKGQMRDDLIMQKWNGYLLRVKLPGAGSGEVLRQTDIVKLDDEPDMAGLDIKYSPGCHIVGIDYTNHRMTVVAPMDPVQDTNDPVVWDVTPWRGSYMYKQRLRIGGANFIKNRWPQSVKVGPVESTEFYDVEQNRFTVVLPIPSEKPDTTDMVEVTVTFTDGTSFTLTRAFLWGNPGLPMDLVDPSKMPGVPSSYVPVPASNSGIDESNRTCYRRNMAAVYARDDLVGQKVVGDEMECQQLCGREGSCNWWFFQKVTAITDEGQCIALKKSSDLKPTLHAITGPKECPPLPTTTTTATTTTTTTTTTTATTARTTTTTKTTKTTTTTVVTIRKTTAMVVTEKMTEEVTSRAPPTTVEPKDSVNDGIDRPTEETTRPSDATLEPSCDINDPDCQAASNQTQTTTVTTTQGMFLQKTGETDAKAGSISKAEKTAAVIGSVVGISLLSVGIGAMAIVAKKRQRVPDDAAGTAGGTGDTPQTIREIHEHSLGN